jgi:2-phosphosulfolactate phosphatase
MEIVEAYGIEEAPAARGHVVVIDVLRAFTCAAYAFDAGAASIVLVSTVDEALALKRSRPDVLLMGEVGGRIIPGFDFGNSPHDLSRAAERLRGRTLVQRTGSGTQGVTSARGADAVYLGSLPVASATCRHLRRLGAETVTLLAMGSPSGFDGPEDVACRTYMAAMLRGGRPDEETARRAVRESKGGRAALDPAEDWISERDLWCATQVDRWAFAMPVRREDGLPVARRVDLPHADRLGDRRPFEVQAALAARCEGTLPPPELVRLAERLVDLGFEHPGLYDLCGLTSFDPRWAGERLDEATAALGLVPDHETTRLISCVATALAIVEGRVSPEHGAASICSLSFYGFEFRGADRKDWCLFDENCWNPETWTPPRSAAGFRAAIRAHALHVVRRYGPPSLTR